MFIFMSDFSRCFSSIQSILHLQAVSRGQLPLQDSTHAADRALHALCRWPMLVLLLVLPLPLPMCDTECAIFFFSLVYIPQIFSFFFPLGMKWMKGIVWRLSALGCSSAKRFPAKFLADLFLFT